MAGICPSTDNIPIQPGDLLIGNTDTPSVLTRLGVGGIGTTLLSDGKKPVWGNASLLIGMPITGGTPGDILIVDPSGLLGEQPPAALTKTNDTNVTLTLGGTPATSLLQAVSLTLGWTGTLAVGRGGTGLSALGTSLQVLRTNAAATALEYATLATGISIGDAVGGGTPGSVLFVGAGPILSQDNANFFYNPTTHALGLGTTLPSGSFNRIIEIHDPAAGGNAALEISQPNQKYGICIVGTELRIFDETAVQYRFRMSNTGAIEFGPDSPVFQFTIGLQSTLGFLGWVFGANAASRNWGITTDLDQFGAISLVTSSAKTTGLLDTTRLIIDKAGNLCVGPSLGPSTGTNGAFFTAGTAASGLVAGTAGLYASTYGAVTSLQSIAQDGRIKDLLWPRAAVTTADFSKTNDTVLANITGLTHTLAAGKTYIIDVVLSTSQSNAGGIQVALSGTCTATNVSVSARITDEGSHTTALDAHISALNSPVNVQGGGVTNSHVFLRGSILVNAGGTLTIQAAQQVSDATPTIVEQGSDFSMDKAI